VLVYPHINTTYEFIEKFGCYIFMYIRVENYDADMKLNVLDGRTDEHLVTV